MTLGMLSTSPAVFALAIVAGPVAAAGSPSGPAGPAAPATPMRPVGDCLKRDQVLDRGVIDQRRLVVKALGKRYYDIRLARDCPAS